MQSCQRKVVITGGNSFIGQALARKMIFEGCKVILIVRPGCKLPEDIGVNVHYLLMDNYNDLGKIAGKCDYLINLAWNGTRGKSRMDKELQEKNYYNTMEGIRSILDVGCKKIITAGSQAEYGPQNGIISEDILCRPNTEYGIAKLKLYHSVKDLCKKNRVEYKEPRFFSLYGPNDYPETMIISILKKMLNDRDCDLTEGIQMWDFLYLADAVNGLWKLCSEECDDGVYNFGSGDVRQLRDYVLEMAKIVNTRSTINFGAIPYPETGMVSIWPDICKMQKHLNWYPQISFEEGIKEVLLSLRQ